MQVFISHASLDSELAELVERQLKLGNPDICVFRTTRVGQIPSGKEWLTHIQENIRASDRFLVLLTPWSMRRPWVNFEAGAAWHSEKHIVPVVAGSLEKGEVVEPLRSLQLLSLEDQSEATQAFTDLDSILGDSLQFCSAVVSICARAKVVALLEADWEGVDHDGQFYAWDGPVESLADGQPKPVPPGLVEVLSSLGREQATGMPNDLLNENSKGFSLVYLLDQKRRRKHQLVGEYSQVLLTRERPRARGA